MDDADKAYNRTVSDADKQYDKDMDKDMSSEPKKMSVDSGKTVKADSSKCTACDKAAPEPPAGPRVTVTAEPETPEPEGLVKEDLAPGSGAEATLAIRALAWFQRF